MDSVAGVGLGNGGALPANGAGVLAAFDPAARAETTASGRNPSDLAVLRNGDRGSDVRFLQESLATIGYDPGPADGIFGDRTETAVRAFQRDQGLEVDGIVGRSETWPALLDAVEQAERTSISPSLPVLRNGDRGSSVELLQESLNALGFDSGAADGIFGDRTEGAVRAFQRSRGLGVDGVAGRGETWPALKGALIDRRDQFLRDADAIGIGTPVGQALIRDADRMAGLIERIEGSGGSTGDVDIDALVQAVPASIRNANPDVALHIERIVAVAQQEGLSPAQTAYVLATATHESHLGRFMEELSSGAQYEGRADLGNTQPGDGVRFKGRGYVQITGRRNYTDWSNRLGVDLVGNPELAENPDIAAQILVRGMRDGTFTGRRLDAYVNETTTDFRNARRTVNGTDRADLIAGYAVDFNRALASSPGGSTGGSTGVTVGAEGSSADIWLKHSADIDTLDRRIVDTFDDIVAAWDAAGGPTPVITSGNDGVHSNGSLHYRDLAVDLRANNISDSLAQSIANDLSQRLGSDFDVIFERFPSNPANDHIHLEYDPN